MKKYLPILLILLSGTAAHASMSTRHQSSLQHTVDSARAITSRTANSYSISGSGVTLDVAGGQSADNLVGGFKTIASGAVTEWNIPTATTTAGASFSFSNSFTAGDASNVTGTTATNYTAGSAGSYTGDAVPGSVNNKHELVVAGTTQGAGTSVTAQFVSEITIFD